jgi:hypothetical protein
LFDTFSLLGKISSCKVAGEPGRSRGHGFVHFETEEAARQAIKQVNGLQIGEMTVKVQPFPGAMVQRRAADGFTFVHYPTEEAAKQAIAAMRQPQRSAPAAAAPKVSTNPHGMVLVSTPPPVPAVKPGIAKGTPRRAAEEGDFTVVERRSGPRGSTLGDCIAAAVAPARSQRARQRDGHAPALQTLSRDDCGPLVGAVARDIVEAVVDSGAEESVAPVGLFAATVVPSPMSRAGARYRAANGSRIRNVGQQKVAFSTTEGHHCSMPFQVAEVERPLISVTQLTAAGHRVVLGPAGGQIVHVASGRTIDLVKRGGVYLLLMNMGIGVASGFPRQGK